MTPADLVGPDPVERAERYARKAREHRAKAAAFVDPVDLWRKRHHQREAVHFEAMVRSIANGLIYLARYGREASDER